MMLLDDLQVTARLAHLGLSEDELRAALPAFEQMLEYFARMQGALIQGEHGSGLDSSSVHSDLVISSETLQNNNPAAGNNLNNSNNLSNNPSNHPLNNPLNAHQLNNAVSALLDQAGERNGPFIVIPNVL
ncbi:MAG: hypothetical protein SNJ56_03480 [Termitinemataceae bacterium]